MKTSDELKELLWQMLQKITLRAGYDYVVSLEYKKVWQVMAKGYNKIQMTWWPSQSIIN